MTPSRFWLAAQAIVTCALLLLLARNLDLRAMQDVFERLPAWLYAASLAIVLAGQVAYAWRWKLLLRAAGVDVPLAIVTRQYFIGIFANNFLPSTVGGDVAKIYYLGQRHGYRVVAASVAIDRLLGVGLLAALACAALWMSPVTAPRLNVARMASGGIAILAASLLLLTHVGTGGLPGRVAVLGDRAVRMASKLQQLRVDMAAPLARPRVVFQAAAVVIGYALAATIVYVMCVETQQAPPPFTAMFAVVTAATVLSNVPVSLNGLGLREQLHASLFVPLGVAPETAVGISLLLYAHLLVASAIGYAFWSRRQRVTR